MYILALSLSLRQSLETDRWPRCSAAAAAAAGTGTGDTGSLGRKAKQTHLARQRRADRLSCCKQNERQREKGAPVLASVSLFLFQLLSPERLIFLPAFHTNKHTHKRKQTNRHRDKETKRQTLLQDTGAQSLCVCVSVCIGVWKQDSVTLLLQPRLC